LLSNILDMEILVRQNYLNKIEKYLGMDTIIVLTGQRRVGKSCVLRMLRDIKQRMRAIMSYILTRKRSILITLRPIKI
jgi:predicted AAA+ superfamily ATPase